MLLLFRRQEPCLFSIAGCSDVMNQSLFLVGEIGGNDYNLPLLAGALPLDDVIAFAPVVIAKISSTITVSTSFAAPVVFAGIFTRIATQMRAHC